MGSRTLPTKCSHGTLVDWGDFGPTCPESGDEYCSDPENCDSCYPKCQQCEEQSKRWAAKREDLRRRAIGQAKIGNYWAQKVVDLLDGKFG